MTSAPARQEMDEAGAGRTLSRRAFLQAAGAAAASVFLAACSAGEGEQAASPPAGNEPGASPSAGASPTPAGTPSGGASPTALPPLRAMIAQMLVVGFRGLTARDADVAPYIRDPGLGGVVLFDYDVPLGIPVRNIQGPAQVRALTAGLKGLSAAPLIVCCDQEGGQVARLNERYGFPPTVSAQALGERNDLSYTRQQAGAMAATLAGAGVNLNLAPVVDVNLNPQNPIIGRLGRSFSADPRAVTDHALEFIRAHHQRGVLCTLKHFPGHGSSRADTHLGFVDVTDTWSPVELEPYRHIIAAGEADVVMTAHVFNARLDPDYPATLSRKTIGGLLRGELGFQGVVMSDDLQMGAIRERYSYERAVELCILAGVDLLAIANNSIYEPDIVPRTVDLVERLVRQGRVPEERIRESYARIQRLKSRLAVALPERSSPTAT